MFILGDDFLGKSCVNSAKKLQLLFLNSEIWRLYQLRLAETASPSQNYVNSMSVLSKIQAILTGALSIFEKNTGVCVCVWKEGERKTRSFFWIELLGYLETFSGLPRLNVQPCCQNFVVEWSGKNPKVTVPCYNIMFSSRTRCTLEICSCWQVQVVCPRQHGVHHIKTYSNKYVHRYKYYIHIRADCPINNS